MCYHTRYIFLACGHSTTSPHPIRPSPPCPNQQQHQAPANDIAAAAKAVAASQRPFSFDPSVIVSPVSPHPEPFPAHAPWRLEGPFSTPESASSIADGDERESRNARANTNIDSRITVTGPAAADGELGNKHKVVFDSGDGAGARAEEGQGEATQHQHCGQILIHPYRSYKIEGLCLHCRRRRDTLLASFEVNAIRETVYRESMLAPAQRIFGALSSHAERDRDGGDGVGGDERLKWLPVQLKLPMPTPFLGQNMLLQVGLGGVEQQQQQQQQQRPWRLTLPPAEVPRNGWGLAGMRDGEWI